MPELPEVETVANGVNERIRGERIETVWLGAKPEPFRTDPAEMAAALAGQTIDRVYRVGKHIVFDLGGDLGGNLRAAPVQWIVHLGMTGRLLVTDAAVAVPPHTHAVLGLSSGRELRFVDARRFGRVALLRSEAARFSGPGLEPLEITADAFVALFRGRKQAIKSALLNQALLHGVGNIYADESLFRAGIRPTRQAGRLSRARLLRLREALRATLTSAIELGGSSVSDYVDADGVRGFFQLEHRVYLRTGRPCRVCGRAIHRIVLGGRGTHFCARCQT